MNTIKLKCKNCGNVYIVNRDSYIPDDVKYLESNYCPDCPDYSKFDEVEYFEEYNYEDLEDKNQLKLEL